MIESKFNLPITYLDLKEKIDTNIINDLELLKLNDDNKDRETILQSILNPTSKIGKLNISKQLEYFTTDKQFLKQTQKIIKSWKKDDKAIHNTEIYDKFYELWLSIKEDTSFIDRYLYVDVEYFKFLNHSPSFLQLLSIYNLTSPILSLVLPFILLLVPFFMLKFNGVQVTFSNYYEVLVKIFSKHALGNIFNIMSDVSWEKRVYAIISIVFYFFSIYQNTLICYRFYKNFKDIHDNLFLLKEYLDISIHNMNLLESITIGHDKYTDCMNDIKVRREKCMNIYKDLDKITEFKGGINNMKNKMAEIGHIMKYFYEIHVNMDMIETIEYTFGLNAYMESMNGISQLCREKMINKCTFANNTKMAEAYYPYLMNNNPVKNTVDLTKNMIITGPNASGKTTILKTTIINLLFSQSYGYGFYKKASISVYDKIHCYLNIPDTSGRDSLFQAEARRCKEIIDSLDVNSKHFCIFDELFSGTNPHEACASSYGFVKYLLDNTNMDFILTSHLLDLCNLLKDDIQNNHMDVEKIDNFNFNYTYKLNHGISSVKGGLKVLYDLRYPEEILELSSEIIERI
jgi:hypothetical protein